MSTIVILNKIVTATAASNNIKLTSESLEPKPRSLQNTKQEAILRNTSRKKFNLSQLLVEINCEESTKNKLLRLRKRYNKNTKSFIDPILYQA